MAITKILNINEADDRNPGAHLEHAITYIQNPDKTNEKVLVGSINCLPETAFSQMMDTKQVFGKMGKRQGYHCDCFSTGRGYTGASDGSDKTICRRTSRGEL